MNSMKPKPFDLVGIGNALVDVLAFVEDSFLEEHCLSKGIMHLIDLNAAASLYRRLDKKIQVSGGSAANTVAGMAMLGGSGAYIGKVCNDRLGTVFAGDLSKLDITYNTPELLPNDGLQTGRSTVLITPDGERTMNTYLGAAELLTPSDIDPRLVSNARWVYLEGYRFDGPESIAAFTKAIRLCSQARGKVALTLSDPFCVQRHREAFRQLISEGVDLLFCNRDELLSMYPGVVLEEALKQAASAVPMVACTASEYGAVIAQGQSRIRVEAWPTAVKDATGAGDMFAAGMLYGLISGAELKSAGMMGCAAACEVIGHIGARPQKNLLRHFRELGIGTA